MNKMLTSETAYNDSVHNDVLRFIDTLKGHQNPDGNDAHEIIEEIYTCGNCYKFGQLLQLVFPHAELYGIVPMLGTNIGHVVTKINDRYYDITGEWKLEEQSFYSDFRLLTKNDHEMCNTYVYSFPHRHAWGLRDEEGNRLSLKLMKNLEKVAQ